MKIGEIWICLNSITTFEKLSDGKTKIYNLNTEEKVKIKRIEHTDKDNYVIVKSIIKNDPEFPLHSDIFIKFFKKDFYESR